MVVCWPRGCRPYSERTVSSHRADSDSDGMGDTQRGGISRSSRGWIVLCCEGNVGLNYLLPSSVVHLHDVNVLLTCKHSFFPRP